MQASPLLLVHGGAGRVPARRAAEHRQGCLAAAQRGGEVLAAGGSAVEAVCCAVEALEDDPLYNAGTGCALDRAGRVSLDAAVMDGARQDAGAVANLPPFRHPVRIALRLLEEPTLLLTGEAAARWAEEQGFLRVPEETLIPPHTREAWERVIARGGPSNWAGGTVGAVARDAGGRMAAATSTGGTMGKLPGRVGDSPVPGAGTWADGRCAISATGEGEAFLRMAFAATLSGRLAAGADPAAVLSDGLQELRDRFGGLGGAIMVTADPGPHAFRTTPAMSHAWWTPGDSASGA